MTKHKQTTGCKRQLALTTKDLRAISSEESCNTAAWSQRSPTQDVLGRLVCKEERCRKEPHTVVRTASLDRLIPSYVLCFWKTDQFHAHLGNSKPDGGGGLIEESRQNEGTKQPSGQSSHQTAMSTAHLGPQCFCCLTAEGLQCKQGSSGCSCRTVSLLASAIINPLPPLDCSLISKFTPQFNGYTVEA